MKVYCKREDEVTDIKEFFNNLHCKFGCTVKEIINGNMYVIMGDETHDGTVAECTTSVKSFCTMNDEVIVVETLDEEGDYESTIVIYNCGSNFNDIVSGIEKYIKE